MIEVADAVPEGAESYLALETEDASNFTAHVVVVDLSSWALAADSAETPLLLDQIVDLVGTDAVVLLEVVKAAVAV